MNGDVVVSVGVPTTDSENPVSTALTKASWSEIPVAASTEPFRM